MSESLFETHIHVNFLTEILHKLRKTDMGYIVCMIFQKSEIKEKNLIQKNDKNHPVFFILNRKALYLQTEI